ncbi:MAG: TlyA family RNA methyltransferase [Acidobacteria bacterium]|nr:TlyA family RNA methyltransferase [Acidobacteriota bacterium]
MRLDQLLVVRGLFGSRERARQAILAGAVDVEGRPIRKPAAAVEPEARLEIRAAVEPFVSRGGRKLAAALDHFELDPAGWTCLDAGASTGGFTDCLLSRGARRVYAIDVGHDQLAPHLRSDPRVVSWEGINARHLPADFLPEACRLVVADLSFISMLKVAPALLSHLEPGGVFLPLLKPQFEVGPAGVGKGGIVRDPGLRQRVLGRVYSDLEAMGLDGWGLYDCPVPGSDGNQEAFGAFSKGSGP